MRRALGAALVVVLATGCSTYRDQLARSQRAFDANNHERALGLLRDLETDRDALGPAERAEYAYLRGMTDYRIGYRADARHWLALAIAHEEASPGVLPAAWKERARRALTEMNDVVYERGLAALAESPKPGEDPSR